MSYVLGTERDAARLSPLGLTLARMGSASVLIALHLLIARPAELVSALRRQGGSLVLCGALVVPGYNLALYSAQARGLPASVASIVTTLVPLFVALLSFFFLQEQVSRRKWLGILVGFSGVVVIALSRPTTGTPYPAIVALAMLAPISWSLYSVISKRALAGERTVAQRVSPLVWSYASVLVGTLLLTPLLPRVAGELAALDWSGWLAVVYLGWPCTVLGFAIWTWLLEHLQASTVGLTVFLNPPLTLLSKSLLAWSLPQIFGFAIVGQEILGGAIVLLGLAIAVVELGNRRRRA